MLEWRHMESDILIRMNQVSRTYTVGSQVVRALEGLNLQVGSGEFLALVGPSGSGKSTLLNMLGGLDRPTGGTVHVDGLEVGQATDAQLVQYRRHSVGFIFQSFNLLAYRTAAENVEVPLTLAQVKPALRRVRALELLQAVGLGERAHHRPNQLSGGEMQRVAVARSLANRPRLLLADEPTGNLDSKTGRMILGLLRDAVREHGVTLVLVTHDLSVASHADRVVHMADGAITKIESGTAPRVEITVGLADPAHAGRPLSVVSGVEGP